MWVQQLLRLGDPFLWGVLVPFGVLAWLVIIAYALPVARPQELGAWFPRGNRLAQAWLVLIVIAILVLTLLSLLQANPA